MQTPLQKMKSRRLLNFLSLGSGLQQLRAALPTVGSNKHSHFLSRENARRPWPRVLAPLCSMCVGRAWRVWTPHGRLQKSLLSSFSNSMQPDTVRFRGPVASWKPCGSGIGSWGPDACERLLNPKGWKGLPFSVLWRKLLASKPCHCPLANWQRLNPQSRTRRTLQSSSG